MSTPAVYASRRNLSGAYTRGWRAGTIADVGGVALPPYLKGLMVTAFRDGFEAAQRQKDGTSDAGVPGFPESVNR